MNQRRKVRLSKRLAYVLRHDPGSIKIELDEAGWVEVAVLLEALAAHGVEASRAELDEVVRTSAKKRFAFSDDGVRIRASQGHSLDVELGYEPTKPPTVLYHGTYEAAVSSIEATGLEPRGRHHVHLSADTETARDVGGRRGRPVIFEIDAEAMTRDGAIFYVSANGVWLVDAVAPNYLRILRGPKK